MSDAQLEQRLLAEAIEDEEARLDARDREDRTKEMSEWGEPNAQLHD